MTDAWVPPNSDYPPPAAGEPLLHRAARLGDHDAIRELVAGGADIDELFDVALDPGAYRSFVTPLGQAAGSADGATAETLRLLLGLGASLNAGPDGCPALWYACGGMGWNYPPGGDADRLTVLLEAGEDASWTRSTGVGGPGQSLLAHAALSGDPDRIRLLLGAGADPEPAGIQGSYEWPLNNAVESGSAPAVVVLLEAGADVNRPLPRYGGPLLGLSASAEVVSVLLQHGADLDPPREEPSNRRDPEDDKALVLTELASSEAPHAAELVAMLRLVIDALDVPAALVDRALRHAVFEHEPDAVEALLAVSADPLSIPHLLGQVCFGASFMPDTAIERVIDLLIDAGLDPNDEDDTGFRPLHTALSPDTFGPDYQESDGFSAPAALALLRRGAASDIVFPTTTVVSLEGHVMSGATALHAAALGGGGTVVEALLDAGADTSALTPDGHTALDLATTNLAEATRHSAWRPQPATADAAPWEQRKAAEELQSYEYCIAQVRRCVDLLEQVQT